jgi:hypothetical protein
MNTYIKQKSEPYNNPPLPHVTHQKQEVARVSNADDILKGFVLLGLLLMISFTILYILRHCITDMVLRYDMSSKGEMLMYLLVLVTFIVTFWLYLTY